MDYIVQPQVPIDEIAMVLLARMWKIHVCIFLEGKYWTTNLDQALDKATFYLAYVGKNVYCDTTRKGSLHWSIMEAPHKKYNIRKPQPKLPTDSPVEAPLPSGHKKLNSLQAGLTDDKAKRAAQWEYHRLNPKVPRTPKPSSAPMGKNKKAPKGKLHIQHHGIPKCHPRMRKLKCPVCSEVFSQIKDLNNHV